MAIPFQGEPIKYLMQGVSQGQNLMQQILARKQAERQARQFEQEMLFNQAKEKRLSELAPSQLFLNNAKAQEAMGNAAITKIMLDLYGINPNGSSESSGAAAPAPTKFQTALQGGQVGLPPVPGEENQVDFNAMPAYGEKETPAGNVPNKKDVMDFFYKIGKFQETPTEKYDREMAQAAGIENIKREAAINKPTPTEQEQAKPQYLKTKEAEQAKVAAAIPKANIVYQDMVQQVDEALDLINQYPEYASDLFRQKLNPKRDDESELNIRLNRSRFKNEPEYQDFAGRLKPLFYSFIPNAQAELTKNGSAFALKTVQQTKPSIFFNKNYITGLLKEIRNESIRKIDNNENLLKEFEGNKTAPVTSAKPVEEKTFSSREEAIAWYNSLSPEEKEQVKKSKGNAKK